MRARPSASKRTSRSLRCGLVRAVLVLAAALPSCNPEDSAVFQGGGKPELKPETTLLKGGEGLVGLNAKADEAKPVAKVTYNIKVTAASGAQLCNGQIKLQIMSDFGLEVPSGRVQCSSLSVDIAGLLGSGISLSDKGGDENVSHDGKVLSLRTIGGMSFDPPRPFLIGPVVQDPAKFKGFKRTSEHTVTGTDPDTKEDVDGSGSFTLEVLDEQTTYENKHVGKAFSNVMHWRVSATGFEGVPAKSALLFRRWEWFWNVRPIMIPKILFEGKLGDFIGTEEGGSTEALVGDGLIELSVTEYKFD